MKGKYQRVKSKRTSLSRVAARDLGTRLLIVDKPFLQAPHDAPAVMEGCLCPLLLGVMGGGDFPGDFIWGIGEDGIEMVRGGRVISCDVSTASEGYRGEEAVGAEVSLERGLGQLLCCPSFFDLLAEPTCAR